MLCLYLYVYLYLYLESYSSSQSLFDCLFMWGQILSDMSHIERSGCNWVPYHSRQRILSAFALSVEELGIGDVIKNAMQNDHGPLILKVSINQTQKDMKTIT